LSAAIPNASDVFIEGPIKLTLPEPSIQFLANPVFAEIAPFPERKPGQPVSLLCPSQQAPHPIGRMIIGCRPRTTCDPHQAIKFRGKTSGHDFTWRDATRQIDIFSSDRATRFP
jgi:hypothetical protein